MRCCCSLQVTILHYDGRAKPTTYGLEVGKEATVQEIMDAAAPLAGLDPACEQFIAMNGGHGSGSSHLGAHFVEASRVVSRAVAVAACCGRMPRLRLRLRLPKRVFVLSAAAAGYTVRFAGAWTCLPGCRSAIALLRA